jgi:uncharacterized protein
MKVKSRFLGIDDGPFTFGDTRVALVGVAVQAPSYIEGVLTDWATVDGVDGTERILGLVRRSRYREGLRMVFLNGVAVGGFNVVDLNRLYADLQVPIVTVTRRAPNLGAMRAALRRRFPDWETRWAQITAHPIEEVGTGHTPVRVSYVGTRRDEVVEALSLTTIRGAIPEPLRIAHLIAAGLAKGESHGRA